MACRECHLAKVKCDKLVPCARCVRLGKVCVRHESRQGQGRTKKRARTKLSEDAVISTEVGTHKPNHHGLQYLIRSWVSLALRRRNFGLLARAGMIADRSGISMDQILCEYGTRRGMDFLYTILLTPAPQQVVLGSRLSWSEVPQTTLVAAGCVGATDGINDPIVAHRWIWIREIRQGISRYLCTPAFERDIADWSLIQQTYQENKKSVVELFLAPADIAKHTKALAHQIALYSTPGLPRTSSRMKNRVKLKQKLPNPKGGTPMTSVEVDQVFCLDIQNLDHDYSFHEYVRRVEIQPNVTAEEVDADAAFKSGLDLGLPLLDLDNFGDDEETDLDFFLNVLK
jgi:Fungal Zn(2)-Cys(6) binuclear cluster domain